MMAENAADDPDDSQDATDRLLQKCLDRLIAGDPGAKDELLGVAYERLTKRARQMLRQFPAVRRWNDTGDVVQEACIRLVTTLEAIQPDSPRRFVGLVGLHIRRVLIDLYRHCRGPESYEANRGTNVFRDSDGELHHHVDGAAATGDDADLPMFERLHRAAEQLDEVDQELFHMRWFLGMTHAQIAAQIGCSEKTVKRDWHRIKTLLWRQAKGESGL